MREHVLARECLKKKREEDERRRKEEDQEMTQGEDDFSTVRRKSTVGEECTGVSTNVTTESEAP